MSDWSDYLKLFALVFGCILSVNGVRTLTTNAWRATFGKHRHARKQIARLGAGLTLDYFADALGMAATRRTEDDLSEHIWLDPLFHVQAITDSTDVVVRWAVTTRHRRLHLKFVVPPAGTPCTTIELGRTTFAALDVASIRTVIAFHGARRWVWAEHHYFGNPGRYQMFWLADDDSTPMWSGQSVQEAYDGLRSAGQDDPALGVAGADLPESRAIAEFRRVATVNTYGETAPGYETDPFVVGPDRDHVRLAPMP